MVRRLILLGLLIFLAGCGATPAVVPTETPLLYPSPQPTGLPGPLPSAAPTMTAVPLVVSLRFVQGDLINQVARLEEAMPGENSGRFLVPTTAELAVMAELVGRLLVGDTGRAGGIAAENGYELLDYADRGDGNARELLLREVTSGRKGWGLYVFRQGVAQDIVVEAPHPRSDENTPRIALEAYRVLSARALLIAGAHRQANQDGSADVAHSPQTAFESIHEALVATNQPLVIQVHGFSAEKHPGYPQVVLGGQGSGTSLLESLATALRQKGVRVGICGSGEWEDLCGEMNVQAGHSGNGGFLHVELDETIRANAESLIAALQEILP